MHTELIETISNAEDFISKMISRPVINLDLAGILFVAACTEMRQGDKHYSKLQLKIEKLKKEIENNRSESGDFTYDFRTKMFRKLRELEQLYEPVVRHFSCAKILAVNAAEAYINEVAGCELKGKQFEEFDKLSLVGKWLFLPSLLKSENHFSQDKNPLQGFITLVKQRNKLVHFKGSRLKLNNPEIPKFLDNFNLTPSSVKANIDNVKMLISEFSESWIGSCGPDWLNALDQTQFRRPCFYTAARNCAGYLYSRRIDGEI